MRIIDLLKIPQNIHRGLEQRSNEKGQEVANAIIASTSQGRGLWIFLLFPSWFMVFASVISITHTFLDIPYWAGGIAGLISAVSWWELKFTREHPFWSSMLPYIGLMVLIVLAGK